MISDKQSFPKHLARRRRSSVSDHHGFTLIELLVVVAIIVVLIAILLPSLSKARNSARQVACGSNLRQIGTVMHVYAHDNRGKFPLNRNDYFLHSQGDTFHVPPQNAMCFALRKGEYLTVRKVFYCPSAVSFNIDSRWNTGVIGYMYLSNNVAGPVGWIPESHGVSDEKVVQIMTDISYLDTRSPPGTQLYSHGGTAPQGVNSLYTDGHVTWNQGSELKIWKYSGAPAYLF